MRALELDVAHLADIEAREPHLVAGRDPRGVGEPGVVGVHPGDEGEVAEADREQDDAGDHGTADDRDPRLVHLVQGPVPHEQALECTPWLPTGPFGIVTGSGSGPALGCPVVWRVSAQR